MYILLYKKPLKKKQKNKPKTVEYQGEKQMKAIEDHGRQLHCKQPDNKYTSNNELLFSKEGKIFKNIYNKRLNKIDKLSKKIDYGDLKFIVNSSGLETDFSKLKDPVAFLDSAKNMKYW